MTVLKWTLGIAAIFGLYLGIIVLVMWALTH